MNKNNLQANRKDAEYYLFMAPEEKLVFKADGVLNNIISGTLILTDSKLFFYFISNISRDRSFIATYPFIVSAELKQGFSSSSLIIKNRKETFEIKKMNKALASEFAGILNEIISQNKQE
ncbi:MAG: PH domain-containing protein [Actinobacteria bacterium]|nr:PH domain-containing protein [Actinomycetota bacterium]